MPDKVLFAEGSVTVSLTRLVFDGDTYAMANISSCKVRFTEEQDDRLNLQRSVAVVASVVLGVALAILLHPVVTVVGGIGVVAAFIYIRPGYQLFHLYVGTNSGEMEVLSSRDEKLIRQIERSINDAIVERG